jgi:hypothetical protein
MFSHQAACPSDYHYGARSLDRAPAFAAETLYVVGGLYGNPEALETVLALRAREEQAGRRVTLVCNGDFNWFNVAQEDFRRINEAVLGHHAILGNVEAELGREGGPVQCGCNYPPHVEQGVVERSHRIFARLRETARAFPALCARLRALPMTLVVRVGAQRIGILHGDAESLAGWSLAGDALAGLAGEAAGQGLAAEHGGAACAEGVPQTPLARVEGYFRDSGLSAFATTHTCLPFVLNLRVDGRERVIVNNGSAGMPNFRGLPGGLLTRISSHPAPPGDSLYGLVSGGVRYDALPIPYDQGAWLRRFLAQWPPGSPVHSSYHDRIAAGPDYAPEQAIRGRATALRPRRTA